VLHGVCLLSADSRWLLLHNELLGAGSLRLDH
jgi:hypothetical protein